MTHIGLVSGWQTVNIGDVAHTPGALTALRRGAPDATITLLAKSIDGQEREMLQRYFPEVNLIEEDLSPDVAPNRALEQFLSEVDVLAHGSGPGLVARVQLAEWSRLTGKPYGFFGVTNDPLRPYSAPLDVSARMIDTLTRPMLGEAEHTLLAESSFFYTRDSLTLRFLQQQGITADPLAFGPDATVMCDFYDDSHADALIEEYGLTPGQYLCVVPRLRITPYYRIKDVPLDANAMRNDAYNAIHTTSDMQILVDTMIWWVRTTGLPVLVVPEMSYAMDLAAEEIGPRLPADVAPQVHILPRFWPLEEAVVTYRHAAAVVSMECHAPLMALAEGVPALYVRQPSDTIKGEMYHDLDLSDHIIEVESPQPAEDVRTQLAAILDDPTAVREHIAQVRQKSHDQLHEMAAVTERAGNTDSS